MLAKGSLEAQLMTADEILHWRGDGHEIGSHTVDHVYLSQLSRDEQLQQLQESKHYLEGILGETVDSFCYPLGDIDDKAIHGVQDGSYRSSVASHRGQDRTDDTSH